LGTIWRAMINNANPSESITFSQVYVKWSGTATLRQVDIWGTVLWSNPTGVTSPASINFTQPYSVKKNKSDQFNLTFSSTDNDVEWVKIYLSNGCYIQWVKP
jgi:hypothetical protein